MIDYMVHGELRRIESVNLAKSEPPSPLLSLYFYIISLSTKHISIGFRDLLSNNKGSSSLPKTLLTKPSPAPHPTLLNST